jgi:hypothetical protein
MNRRVAANVFRITGLRWTLSADPSRGSPVAKDGALPIEPKTYPCSHDSNCDDCRDNQEELIPGFEVERRKPEEHGAGHEESKRVEHGQFVSEDLTDEGCKRKTEHADPPRHDRSIVNAGAHGLEGHFRRNEEAQTRQEEITHNKHE